jgi:hypothetical protein
MSKRFVVAAGLVAVVMVFAVMAGAAAHVEKVGPEPWPHPQSKKLEDKSTYVRNLVTYDGWVGVGIYK